LAWRVVAQEKLVGRSGWDCINAVKNDFDGDKSLVILQPLAWHRHGWGSTDDGYY
jgi:hypothetical protein